MWHNRIVVSTQACANHVFHPGEAYGGPYLGSLEFFPILLVRDLVRHGGVLRHIKMVSFKYFRSLRSVSLRFWTGLGADHTVF